MFVLYVTIVALLDAMAIVSAKYWQITKQLPFLVTTVLAFAFAGFFFARSLQYEGMAITNIIWMALSTLCITSIGYFLFKETITTLQFIGIATIVVGLILINLK
jgi:small multidrug resistance pump